MLVGSVWVVLTRKSPPWCAAIPHLLVLAAGLGSQLAGAAVASPGGLGNVAWWGEHGKQGALGRMGVCIIDTGGPWGGAVPGEPL